MAYIDENLIAGETVLYRTRLHWIVMTGPVVLSVVLGLPGLFLLFRAISTLRDKDSTSGALALWGLALLAAAVVTFCWGAWHRSSTEMAVTNKRVLIKLGMISRNTTEMMLSKVESVTVNQTVLGRVLGFGAIIVRGTGGTPEPFAKIAHPLEFRHHVQEQLDGLQNQLAVTTGV